MSSAAVGNKIRIYDLAREVKQDTKRILEDARREGIDVSVPSNTVPKEVAEKIRSKYFPKKEVTVQRAVKLIKHKPQHEENGATAETNGQPAPIVAEVDAPAPEATKPAPVIQAKAQPETTVQPAPSAKTSTTTRLIKRIPKAEPQPEVVEAPPIVEQPQPQAPVVEAETEVAEPIVAEAPAAPAVPTEEPKLVEPRVEQEEQPTITPVAKPAPARGTEIKRMTLTKAALEAGMKAGERVQVPTPPKPVIQQPARFQQRGGTGVGSSTGGGDVRRPDRGNFNRDPRNNAPQMRGTAGETATPMTTYTPPSKPKGRNQKGHQAKDKHGRDKFAERDLGFAPRPKTLEEKLQEQINKAGDSKTVRLVEGATVREFAEKLGIAPRDVVQLLIKRGIFATLNQPINPDVASDLGKRFGYDVSFIEFEEMVAEEEFEELILSDADDVETARAPVVTVMGHVDHGKTSLLDAIRQANVAGGEAGGITQHIGAYSVFVPSPDNTEEKRRVVFLDTPGHEAFTMMRARGAKATDVVVLVVAADDGVMPQTIEAIEHAKAAEVPIIVAINKVDKPDSNPDRVRTELAGQGLSPVEWGGETEMVEVSAKMKQNLDTLLETILLTSDILDLKASPTRRASGVVLESKLDRGRGAVATVLVQQGTLHIGDPIIAGQYSGRVRAMFSDRGEILTEAPPATPVEVLGLGGVPQAGDTFLVVADIERATEISHQRQMQARAASLVKTTARGLESLGGAGTKELLVILKTDVQGSVEVLRATLEKLSTEKVKVRVIRSGVGAITESDVLLASATQADDTQTAVVIIGFNVRPEARAAEVAKSEEVDIRLHSIIYKVEEEIRAAMIGMLDAIEREVILGHALVQEVFKISRVGTIAGCRVLDGVMRRTARARLIRDGVVSWEGELDSLKRFKEDASEVREGFECGIGLKNFNDIKVGDQIEAFTIERIAATEL
ncbi:MAG: translation initiation factor IF-2 [Acidobacteriota bacterium]|nr:translation initiation factor IF-2 [Acidobacteriota bacterium]